MYDIAERENTENILRGLERAVENTGTLPYEILSDNHSFNKTKEANNLKAQLEALGVTWTVDSNPRRKAILERSFRTLGEEHFKNLYGYIGQGIKSRIRNGITQQELQDHYSNKSRMTNYSDMETKQLIFEQKRDDRYDRVLDVFTVSITGGAGEYIHTIKALLDILGGVTNDYCSQDERYYICNLIEGMLPSIIPFERKLSFNLSRLHFDGKMQTTSFKTLLLCFNYLWREVLSV